MPQIQSTESKLKITFGIRQIQIMNFNIDKSEKHLLLTPNHKYTFEFIVAALLDTNQKFIGIDLTINLFTSELKDDKVCELTIRSTYHVLNFNEIVSKKENNFIISDIAMQHLTAVTLSTARGIFFVKVQDSFLSNIIIPIIDITSFNKIDNLK